MGKRVIISISSDIGFALANRWLKAGHEIIGTYRTQNLALQKLQEQGVKLVHADLKDVGGVKKACQFLKDKCSSWEFLVMAPGAQEPIGAFAECDFDQWKESVSVNLLEQLRILHELLPFKNNTLSLKPLVLFFAGGGTNNATSCYSAYTISKIASIKMMELLDAEIPDIRFSIMGPGWVKTKIHKATLNAKDKAGDNYLKTIEKLEGNECNPMERVLDCCDWMMTSPREVISGRNFSCVFDQWDNPELVKVLKEDGNIYKLRRFGNDCLT